MRATTLKRKYPEIWLAVEEGILFDDNWRYLSGSSKEAKEAIAHNAAFEACLAHNKAIKKESKNV